MKYDQGKKYFHIDDVDLYVKAPQFGMMFPAFADRQTNLYGALYYAKKKDDVGEELYHCFFGADAPLCLDEQAARFGAVLKGAYNKLELETVQAVSASIREKLDAQKESDDNGPLILSADTVGDILREYGASDSEVAKAEGAFEEQYGSDGTVVASNVDETGCLLYDPIEIEEEN